MLNFGECSLRALLGTRTPDTSCLPCYPCPANITSLLIYQGLFEGEGMAYGSASVIDGFLFLPSDAASVV